jgi:predicted site-specific integrase-resolvase
MSNLTPEDLDDPFYDVKDIALLFKVEEYTVRKWLRDGLIPEANNIGGKAWRARRSAVLEFAQRKYGS